MRIEEAQRIFDVTSSLPAGDTRICLNLGSSTSHFRTNVQPHISTALLDPLTRMGWKIINCDLKEAPGVDLIGDIYNPEYRARLRDINPSVVLCSNLLEHLENPKRFAELIADFAPPKCYVVVTVPSSYPYHPDPIDTYLRPTPRELASLFPNWEVLIAETVVSTSYLQDLRSKGQWKWRLFINLLYALLPFYRPMHWKSKAHRLLWLFRPYKVALCVLRMPQDSTQDSQ